MTRLNGHVPATQASLLRVKQPGIVDLLAGDDMGALDVLLGRDTIRHEIFTAR